MIDFNKPLELVDGRPVQFVDWRPSFDNPQEKFAAVSFERNGASVRRLYDPKTGKHIYGWEPDLRNVPAPPPPGPWAAATAQGFRPGEIYAISAKREEQVPHILLMEGKPVTPEAPTAPGMLTKAAELMAERGKEYDQDQGERSMGRAVAAFNAITGHELTEPQGWLLLQVLKDVRLFTKPGYHQDSAEDCIAYAALKAEAKAREAA
jgi:hypothetical protein